MNQPKFEFGQTVYYVDGGTNYRKRVPCPMCFGELFVTIILGNKEHQRIECGYCSHGCDRPSGTAIVWEPEASIVSGAIKGIQHTPEGSWIYDIAYHSVSEHEIYGSKEEAEPARLLRFTKEKERAEKYFVDSYKQAKPKQVWSAGYHRNHIKTDRRSIEWHELRLGMIKEGRTS